MKCACFPSSTRSIKVIAGVETEPWKASGSDFWLAKRERVKMNIINLVCLLIYALLQSFTKIEFDIRWWNPSQWWEQNAEWYFSSMWYAAVFRRNQTISKCVAYCCVAYCFLEFAFGLLVLTNIREWILCRNLIKHKYSFDENAMHTNTLLNGIIVLNKCEINIFPCSWIVKQSC